MHFANALVSNIYTEKQIEIRNFSYPEPVFNDSTKGDCENFAMIFGTKQPEKWGMTGSTGQQLKGRQCVCVCGLPGEKRN